MKNGTHNMSDSKEKIIQERIRDLLEDVMTNETAILQKSDSSVNEYKIVSYSKTELGGDSIHFANNLTENLIELDKALIISTLENRKAVWNFLIRALS